MSTLLRDFEKQTPFSLRTIVSGRCGCPNILRYCRLLMINIFLKPKNGLHLDCDVIIIKFWK